MYPQATHRREHPLFFFHSRSLSRTLPLLLYFVSSLSLFLSHVTSCSCQPLPPLFPHASHLSLFRPPSSTFFSAFDHQRHVRRTNAGNVLGIGAGWKDIPFVRRFLFSGILAVRLANGCARIVLDVLGVIGERTADQRRAGRRGAPVGRRAAGAAMRKRECA